MLLLIDDVKKMENSFMIRLKRWCEESDWNFDVLLDGEKICRNEKDEGRKYIVVYVEWILASTKLKKKKNQQI